MQNIVNLIEAKKASLRLVENIDYVERTFWNIAQ